MSKGPVFKITNNSEAGSDDRRDGISSRNPSWLVAFVRYEDPVALYSTESDYQKTKTTIIENDCINVTVNRPKANPTKQATLTMKVGELYFPGLVAPGDWVFIWMVNNQEDADRINKILISEQSNPALNDWYSGLKFVGRVTSAGASDTVNVGGVRTLVDTVRCTAFTELTTTVYYTYLSKSMFNPANSIHSGLVNTAFTQSQIETVLSNLNEKYRNFWDTLLPNQRTPDRLVMLMYLAVLGGEKDKNLANSVPGLFGTPNDPIECPNRVARILGNDKADKIWQIMNLYMGMQKYKSNGKTLWEKYSPILEEKSKEELGTMYFSPWRCKGVSPNLMPPVWDNQVIWNLFNNYSNSVVNEVYTALRCNREGRILPAVIVREIPLGTRLFSRLGAVSKGLSKVSTNISQTIESTKIDKGTDNDPNEVKPVFDDNIDIGVPASSQEKLIIQATAEHSSLGERTLFNNLPRWLIDESVLRSINTTTDDNRRINFFMVWGHARAFGFYSDAKNPTSNEVYKAHQLLKENYVADVFDIRRYGLRANVVETDFDYVGGLDGTLVKMFARLRADWFINSHLKLYGTIVCNGIVEPIAEGDNVEVRGILYHIEGITFNGSIDASGKKLFTTTLSVSNGTIAASLDSTDDNQMPEYPSMRSSSRQLNFAPGVTDVQLTLKTNRNDEGEKI